MTEEIRFYFECSIEEMPVERDARIFEAGDYPDKGITVSEDDLDAIVRNFEEVPVKVEHVDSPLDPLGTVRRIWRRGGELYARLAFPRDLAAFLERRGVKKLSVALHRDPLRLAEVSLVLTPRVPSAAMFGEERTGIRKEQLGEGVIEEMNADDIRQSDSDAEIAELRFALKVKDVESQIADLKARGKIVPASESCAREILLRGDSVVEFGEGEISISQLFERFLETQPPVITFGELAPGSRRAESREPLSAEEEELLARLGITREQIAGYA